MQFHINACSLNNKFDEIQDLLSCTKTNFDIIVISETRITKQVSLLNNLNLNNYYFEFTPTETSAGVTLIYFIYLFKIYLQLTLKKKKVKIIKSNYNIHKHIKKI